MLRFGSFVFAMVTAAACCAQEITQVVVDAAPVVPTTVAAPNAAATECCRIASGTLLTLEIMEPLDSSLLKRGDRFRIRLAEPLTMDGHTMLAAGTEGVGEVVHAERSRSGGKAGELLIAARRLDAQGIQVPLRGLKMGGTGKDKTQAALALSFAAGPFALFLQGDEIVIPAGTLAEAKVAQDMDFIPLQAGAGANAADPLPATDRGPDAITPTDPEIALPETPLQDVAPAPAPEVPAPRATDVPSIQPPRG